MRHQELENTAVFYDGVGIIFFSHRNSGWILHIEIICDDVYTYVPPPPAKTEKMSIKKFIHQSSPNVTFKTNSDLPKYYQNFWYFFYFIFRPAEGFAEISLSSNRLSNVKLDQEKVLVKNKS